MNRNKKNYVAHKPMHKVPHDWINFHFNPLGINISLVCKHKGELCFLDLNLIFYNGINYFEFHKGLYDFQTGNSSIHYKWIFTSSDFAHFLCN